MTIVIDTSVAMGWAFEDEVSAVSERALEALTALSGLVPPIFEFEVANALVVGRRRKRISDAQVMVFCQRLSRLRIATSTDGLDMQSVMSAAHRHGLSAYDASYLLLAETAGSALATNDVALRKAAKKAGVALV